MDKETLEFPIILPHEKAKADSLSSDMQERIEELYSEGRNYTEIAREVNISVPRVSYYCNKNRVPLAARLLQKRIVSVIQECEIKSATIGGGKSKTIQINAPIQLVGDKAIEAALFGEEVFKIQNCLEAMKYLLDSLPEPRLENLKTLAVATAIRRHGQLSPAARELGISFRAIRYLKDKAQSLGLPIGKYLGNDYYKYLRHDRKKEFEVIRDGEITFGK